MVAAELGGLSALSGNWRHIECATLQTLSTQEEQAEKNKWMTVLLTSTTVAISAVLVDGGEQRQWSLKARSSFLARCKESGLMELLHSSSWKNLDISGTRTSVLSSLTISPTALSPRDSCSTAAKRNTSAMVRSICFDWHFWV